MSKREIDPDFGPYSCMAWKKLTERYGPKINFNQLFSMAKILSFVSNIPIPSKSKKNKVLLIQWFDEHLDILWPIIIKKIKVIKADGTVI